MARLAQDGRRARAGVLWCSFLPDSTAMPPRVAFAIGRAVGSSVVRNRLRRQLRVILAAADLPPGSLLVGVRPAGAGRSFHELTSDVEALVRQLAKAAES